MAKNLQLQLLIDGCRKGNRASQIRLYEHFFSYGMGGVPALFPKPGRGAGDCE